MKIQEFVDGMKKRLDEYQVECESTDDSHSMNESDWINDFFDSIKYDIDNQD